MITLRLIRRAFGKILQMSFEFLSKYSCIKGKVLMLHNIGGNGSEFDLSIEQFSLLLEKLRGKNLIRLENWEREENFFAITIDDVPMSFYNNAFPLLKAYGYPFTIFVSVSLIDKPGYITTAQLKEISEYPLCTVGSHGVNHTFFAELNTQEAIDDLKKSKDELEFLVKKNVALYAFPYGSYYACGFRNKNIVSRLYKYGFGTVECPITVPLLFKRYFLPRINVTTKILTEID